MTKISLLTNMFPQCAKVSQKLHALARVSKFMDQDKRRLLMKAFVNSQFGFCPLVWMFHSRKLNSRINKLQERALRIVYRDNISSYSELLEKDKSVTVHQRNLQVLATEIFKPKIGINPEIMKEIFQFYESSYNLSNSSSLKRNSVKTVRYGTETVSHLGPIIWNLLPNEMKTIDSLHNFKMKIKEWTTDACPCRLCKTYISQVGFT